MSRRKALLAAVPVLVVSLSLIPAAAAVRGPIHLDDNRSAPAGVQAAINFFAPVVPVCTPGACTGVNVFGRVIASPEIVTLYWDSDWDLHNPNSPTRAAINDFVQKITASSYLDDANQYGVSRGSFHSSHASSSLCQTTTPSGVTTFLSLLAWVQCEVQTPGTGVPLPDDNTIYAVFLPEGVTIPGAPGADCGAAGGSYAFHAFSAAIVPDPINIYLNPLAFKIEGYPFTVVPAQCARVLGDPAATLDHFTWLWTHELIEAALDPVPPTGWVDNTHDDDIKVWLNTGEPADICEPSARAPDGVPTPPVRLAEVGFLVEHYWSNADNACVPIVDATPPVITPTLTGTLGSNFWYVADVTVQWSVADAESAISSSSGCGLTTIATDTDAVGQTLTCTATSKGGTASQSVTIKRDATPPAIGHGISPSSPDGTNGWYRSAPTITFSCSDTGSGIASCLANGDSSGLVTLSEDANPQTVAGIATDNAGNVNSDSASGLLVDLSDPTISAAATTSPNGAGWYNGDVTVHFICADTGGSGIPGGACPVDQTLSNAGTAVVSSAPTVTDAAGNTSDPSNVVTVKIDKTAPTLSPSVSPNPLYLGALGASASSGAADSLSGVASSSCGAVDTSTAGLHTVTCTATDTAGNTNSGGLNYGVGYRFGGFTSPLPKSTVNSGGTLPVKFQLQNAAGQPISNAEAQSLVSPLCKIAIILVRGGPVASCPTYSSTLKQFQFNLKTTNAMKGANGVSITVTIGTTIVTTSPTDPFTVK